MATVVLQVFLAAAALASPAAAGEFNPTLSIGDKAPEWKDLPGVDDKQHSLSDLKDKDVVVVVFTCNSCPYAVDYEDRIIDFAAQHAKEGAKAAVVAINVNRVPEDRLPEMKKRAQDKKFNFPYLYDESQKIARAYGASYTPEFFVLNKERKVVYMGAMDNSANAAKVTEVYLTAAVEAALKGEKPAKTETAARGCAIRYVRERRAADDPKK
ncbi:MAG: thioredoxin family protein [Planctomycetia bacterium]|nr:thioredoxin family protein [Planctomycetia bacterium]